MGARKSGFRVEREAWPAAAEEVCIILFPLF